jgi:excisionase family DNA binding protein
MTNDAGPFEALVALIADQVADRLIAATHADGAAGLGDTAQSPWMNIATAAAYLDWPRQRLYKLTAQGAIPHYKQEGRLLFHRQELDQWLVGHRQGGSDWLNPENRAISR